MWSEPDHQYITNQDQVEVHLVARTAAGARHAASVLPGHRFAAGRGRIGAGSMLRLAKGDAARFGVRSSVYPRCREKSSVPFELAYDLGTAFQSEPQEGRKR
jgi:hypothetical protein